MSALNTAGVNSESVSLDFRSNLWTFVGVGEKSLPQPMPMAAQVQTSVACLIASVWLNNYTLLVTVYREPTVFVRHWWRGAVTHALPIGHRLNTAIINSAFASWWNFQGLLHICLFHSKAFPSIGWLSWEEFRKHSVCLYAKKLEAFVQC